MTNAAITVKSKIKITPINFEFIPIGGIIFYLDKKVLCVSSHCEPSISNV